MASCDVSADHKKLDSFLVKENIFNPHLPRVTWAELTWNDASDGEVREGVPRSLGAGLQASVFSMHYCKSSTSIVKKVAVKIYSFGDLGVDNTGKPAKRKALNAKNLRKMADPLIRECAVFSAMSNRSNFVLHSLGVGTVPEIPRLGIGPAAFIVMEMAEMSLWSKERNTFTDDVSCLFNCLDSCPATVSLKDASSTMKLLWLCELAIGLRDLHALGGVLHRDFTVDNILLARSFSDSETEQSHQGDGGNGKTLSETVTLMRQKLRKQHLSDETDMLLSLEPRISDFGVSKLFLDKGSAVRGAMRNYPPEGIDYQHYKKVLNTLQSDAARNSEDKSWETDLDAKHIYSPAADVWSFGHIIHDIIVSTPYRVDLSKSEVIQDHVLENKMDFSHVKFVFPEVIDVMRECFRYDIAQRLTSALLATQLIEILQKLCET